MSHHGADRLAARRAASRRARRRRRLTAALGAVLVAAVAWIVAGGGGGDSVAPGELVNHEAARARELEADRRRIERALAVAARRAAALGGSVRIAAIRPGWPEPAVAASPPAAAAQPVRMWSMSKVVTAVALLKETGWGGEAGKPPAAEVEEAMESALVRSENCPQRRVVLALQEVTGGPEGARRAVGAVLERSGAESRIGEEAQPPDPSCVEYLEGQREVEEPLAATVLLGTSTWRVADAAHFMWGLGSGLYGEALGERVVATMRRPKERSREIVASEFTARPDWGAARALGDWSPAYKAGWGGSLQGDFLVGQMAWLEPPGAPPVALAAVFSPAVQPPVDDPGLTAGPAAIERAMETAKGALGS